MDLSQLSIILSWLVARLRTIRANELIENISRYNNEYFCTIQNVSIWPDRIQIFIDERGDFSLGLFHCFIYVE